MRSKLFLFLVVLGFVSLDLHSQESQVPPPDAKPEGQEKKSDRPAMRLFDVPSARETASQPLEEVTDYLKITQTRDSAEGARLIEEFLSKYPESKYIPTLHQFATTIYQQMNNYEKMVEHGEKTLTTFPSNPAVLSVLALAYTTRGETEKAIDRASKAITILEQLTRPGNVDEAGWKKERDQYLAMNYASLGSSYVNKYEAESKAEKTASQSTTTSTAESKAAGAPPEKATVSREQVAATLPAPSTSTLHLATATSYLSKAVELVPRYDFAQFQLGIALAYQKKVDKAMDAFAKTMVLEGTFKDVAKQNLEALYKLTHKNSLEGLDQLVGRAKEDLNPSGPAPTTP